ncbi:fish-egg lectin-like [Rhinatrema bivittatum]|uniref:fish-egg lectin-like n=1 Tax=Rhinatrema bivittatum TaxID=194408 RepID=UPI00112A4D25|nr:fish-egg lectin-like [Rhinatrema bivittatum]
MMKMKRLQVSLLLQLLLIGLNSADPCTEIPGSLKQIDVSNGQVFGVNSADQIYTLYENSWTQIKGSLKHISVGPAGIWGVNSGDNIYRLVAGNWVQMPGALKQIDAGGDQFISGVNAQDDIFCLSKSGTIPAKYQTTPPWENLEGKLKYHTCGSLSCWGVNSNDDIFYRWGSTSDSCKGSRWQQVEGKLSMIEVGTEGTVYGANAQGSVFRREGITDNNPIGTSWSQVDSCGNNIKHVSFDLGKLWMVTTDDRILTCSAC